jgi:hypothetical protein
VKVGGRARSDDEDVPVTLLDDDRIPPTITTAEVALDRPRRPRRELLLVVLAIAVVAGVGLVGGGGDGGDPQTATPPTTERRRPRTESIEEFKATSTTTRPRPPRTTTTSTVERLSGQAPLLPDLTGTTLGLLDNSGGVTVLDLDTGDRCRTVPARSGAWIPWSTGIELTTMIVQGQGGLHAVDRDCGSIELGTGAASGWPATVTGTTMWVVDNDDQSSISEVSLLTGDATGRVIAIPAFNGVQAAGAPGALVLGVSGSMTYVDLTSDDRRDLGPGVPLGLRDDVLLYSSCPQLACHVATLDIDSGERRVIGDIEGVMPWESAAFSPDGRYARVSVPHDDINRGPTATVIDLRSGRVVQRTDMQGGVFSRDGRWLIGIANGNLSAVAIDGDGAPLELDIPGAFQNVVVLTNP